MIHRRKEIISYESILFICLCSIFIAIVFFNARGISSYIRQEIYVNTISKEVPIVVNKGDEKVGVFNRLVTQGFYNEMNIIGDAEKLIKEGGNKSLGNISEFSYNYGKYNNVNGDILVENGKGAVSNVFNSSLIYNYPKNKLQVLIYNTHTGEGYRDGYKKGIDMSGIRDNSKNVVAVARALEMELKNYGINVIYDDTIHDKVNYEKAYVYSRETATDYYNKYGNIDMSIDIHRNAIAKNPLDAPQVKASVTGTINDENVAKVLFVFSNDAESYQNGFEVARSLIQISKNLYPEILKEQWNGVGEFHYNKAKFSLNQKNLKNNVLIEVGATCNYVEESVNTAKYLARVIAEYLYNKYTEV